MTGKVTLTIIEGSQKGQEFIFKDRTTCIIGRAKDCYPQIPNEKDNIIISRYHCLLDINPPAIRIRDFGSKNGTYVNNQKIGQRQAHQSPEEAAKIIFPEYDLKSGDEIHLGNTVLKVSIDLESDLIRKNPNIRKILTTPTGSKKSNMIELIKRFQNLLHRADVSEHNLISICGHSITKLLGKGSFGEVYLARNNHTNEDVAIKVLFPEIATNYNSVERFLAEMENTKSLDHPNIVHLIDYGYADHTFFFTFEYCHGGSLIDLIQKRKGKLSIHEAIPIILQVLDGLDYAHNAEIPHVKQADGSFISGRGLVHRDLKPANIFLMDDNGDRIVKIGDYGLAKTFDLAGLSGQTMSGSNVGTPAFMPRQQVINFKYDQPAVDIWAAAATLYYMLTGWLPRDFTNEDPFLTVLKNKPVPIHNRDVNIPKRLADLIDFALVDNPEIHFKTAKDFKHALQKCKL